ncbi:MAG: hypothetical protein H6708_09320 [Kofleriaceae bacterium]|nr:hypothetical protein [Myxococcales bacterium]MCB9560593.1 hypothetical protein [Kofleriaceae bacterium]
MRRPGRTSWVATAALATAALGGCFGDTTTEFPPGLEPLEDDTAPAQQGGSYTETLTMVDGELTNYTWVHGRGYILADPGTVWAASKDVDVMASACSTDTYSAEVGVEPEYEYGFRISYEVDQVITIAWDELWRYGTIEGTPSAPTLAMIRYQKVFGSELIQLIEGSVQLHATDDPDVTEIETIEHLAAAGGGASDIRASMQYRFDSLAAVAHGQPQPPCP